MKSSDLSVDLTISEDSRSEAEDFSVENAELLTENLNFNFILTGLVVNLLLVSLLTVAASYFARDVAKSIDGDLLSRVIQQDVLIEQDVLTLLQSPELVQSILRYPSVESVAIYDRSNQRLWSSSNDLALGKDELIQMRRLVKNPKLTNLVIDAIAKDIQGLKELWSTTPPRLRMLIPLRDDNGVYLGVIQLVRDFHVVSMFARKTAIGSFIILLLSGWILFAFLYATFKKGSDTIKGQELKLNQQISRLSNLLAINKSMQQSMKSASRRAVEMNEQFLRRVGSDLHDGPAQSIGYAVLRLDQASKREELESVSHEYHVVKEALSDSLEEIRGISSGLVLPELEEMTLLECLKKVVSRQKNKSDMQVTDYFKDLPDQIPMPFKICAYRFIQEGINNAQRHGRAKKCRVSAQMVGDVLHLSLKDNGSGFRKSQLTTEGGHLGLMGLKDRIESLGGKFSINSELGVGTAIKAAVQVY